MGPAEPKTKRWRPEPRKPGVYRVMRAIDDNENYYYYKRKMEWDNINMEVKISEFTRDRDSIDNVPLITRIDDGDFDLAIIDAGAYMDGANIMADSEEYKDIDDPNVLVKNIRHFLNTVPPILMIDKNLFQRLNPASIRILKRISRTGQIWIVDDEDARLGQFYDPDDYYYILYRE